MDQNLPDMQGSLADSAVSPGGAALIWVFDFSESEAELAQLDLLLERAEAVKATAPANLPGNSQARRQA